MINRFLEKKKIKLSFQEFFALERGEITLEDIYFNRKLDAMAGRIMKSEYKAVIIFMIACGLILVPSVSAMAGEIDTSKINELGSVILGLVRTCGYWFCIILATKDIVGALMEGSSKQIGSIIVKYITAFGAFYALPWVFDLIADLLA